MTKYVYDWNKFYKAFFTFVLLSALCFIVIRGSPEGAVIGGAMGTIMGLCRTEVKA